jgi:Mce-associated membrane protein
LTGFVNLARSSRLITGLTIVLVVLLLASLLLAMRLADARADRARREAILHAAREQATNLTTYDFANFDSATARVLFAATGDFRTSYESGARRLKILVEQNRSVARSDILEAAIVSADQNSARVLVVGDAQITEGAGAAQIRRFRMQLDLVHTDGRWLSSGLRFVG